MNLNSALFLMLLLTSALRVGATEQPSAELIRAAEIRALDAAARSHLPVRLNGVVLLEPSPSPCSFVIADESAAVYCEIPANLSCPLKRGDQIEVIGHSELGGFAPLVIVEDIKIKGKGTIPPPVTVTFDQLASGSFDSQWIEISGIVRRSELSLGNEFPPASWLCEIATGGERLTILSRNPERSRQQIDTEVRVAGICFYQFNKSGQIIKPLLMMPAEVRPKILHPPLEEAPLRQIDRLMSFASDGFFGHRVRVRGVVTYHLPGEGFWLAGNGHGLRVIQPDGEISVPGEAVEVLGFPAQGIYSPVLEDVAVKRLFPGVSVPPTELKSTAEALDHDSGLVRLDATLIEKIDAPFGLRLLFQDGHGDFEAHLRTEEAQEVKLRWEVGSEMRVTGICQVSKPPAGKGPGVLLARDFKLILRSPADLEILKTPSWWNAERQPHLLTITTAALGIIGGLIFWMARRQFRQSATKREKSETGFAVILAERNRIAREIHDTLAQGLCSISLHLEVVKRRVQADPVAAAHLAEASGITRESIQEVRNSIWNIRSQALEDHDLAGALAGALDELTEIDGIEGKFLVTGTRFRLSPPEENHLLRIGRESIANAVKHAKAKRIDVTLGFTQREVTIRVKDDGCGFDPGKAPTESGHFGLLGIHERARELGAALCLLSKPGHGTEVILEFTIPNTHSSASL